MIGDEYRFLNGSCKRRLRNGYARPFPIMPMTNHTNVESQENKGIIIILFNIIQQALQRLLRCMVILILGMIASILILLPWLLRISSILIWLVGTYMWP